MIPKQLHPNLGRASFDTNRTTDGEAILDVPVGRYKITARYVPAGETPVALTVRLRNVGEYQNSLIANFSPFLTTVQQMVLEVSRP